MAHDFRELLRGMFRIHHEVDLLQVHAGVLCQRFDRRRVEHAVGVELQFVPAAALVNDLENTGVAQEFVQRLATFLEDLEVFVLDRFLGLLEDFLHLGRELCELLRGEDRIPFMGLDFFLGLRLILGHHIAVVVVLKSAFTLFLDFGGSVWVLDFKVPRVELLALFVGHFLVEALVVVVDLQGTGRRLATGGLGAMAFG